MAVKQSPDPRLLLVPIQNQPGARNSYIFIYCYLANKNVGSEQFKSVSARRVEPESIKHTVWNKENVVVVVVAFLFSVRKKDSVVVSVFTLSFWQRTEKVPS